MDLGWGSPIGLGVFLVSIALMLFLLAKTISVLSLIDREQKELKNKK